MGQGGTFDVQRHNGKFYANLTPVANFITGVYLEAAGWSLPETVGGSIIYGARHQTPASTISKNMGQWVNG